MKVLKIILFAIMLVCIIGGDIWINRDKEGKYKKTTAIVKKIGYLAMVLFFVLELFQND